VWLYVDWLIAREPSRAAAIRARRVALEKACAPIERRRLLAGGRRDSRGGEAREEGDRVADGHPAAPK